MLPDLYTAVGDSACTWGAVCPVHVGACSQPCWCHASVWLPDLFNWATGREGDNAITRTQAMSCARRPQGRSWEVVFDKLMELGEQGVEPGWGSSPWLTCAVVLGRRYLVGATFVSMLCAIPS
jgi:hypothetical protein